MARDHGSPFQYARAGTAFRTPTDTGFNALGYLGVEIPGAVFSVESYAMWSVFFIVTAGVGNNELRIVVRNEDDTGDLAKLDLTLAAPGSANYQHLTFGLPGTTLPLVARKIYFTVRNSGANPGTCTIRCMGRAW